jgi:hypothetical protein
MVDGFLIIGKGGLGNAQAARDFLLCIPMLLPQSEQDFPTCHPYILLFLVLY